MHTHLRRTKFIALSLWRRKIVRPARLLSCRARAAAVSPSRSPICANLAPKLTHTHTLRHLKACKMAAGLGHFARKELNGFVACSFGVCARRCCDERPRMIDCMPLYMFARAAPHVSKPNDRSATRVVTWSALFVSSSSSYYDDHHHRDHQEATTTLASSGNRRKRSAELICLRTHTHTHKPLCLCAHCKCAKNFCALTAHKHTAHL